MAVTPSACLTSRSHLQPANARAPISATVSENVIVVSRFPSWNVPSPIPVIPWASRSLEIFPVHSLSTPSSSVLKQLRLSVTACIASGGSSRSRSASPVNRTVTPSGSVISRRLIQLRNAYSSTCTRWHRPPWASMYGKRIFVISSPFANAQPHTRRIFGGITTSPAQAEPSSSISRTTARGDFLRISASQGVPWKARAPMCVTLSGISTCTSIIASRNTSAPIFRIPAGIRTAPAAPR